MKVKYRNFRRLTDVGEIGSGLEGIGILSLVLFICVGLAFHLRESTLFCVILLVPAVGCLVAILLSLRGLFSGASNE